MALPNSGELKFTQVITEFGKPQNKSLSQYYGVASGIPSSGQLSLSMFYGKSNTFSFTISTNSIQPNIRQLAVNAGWDQNAALICNITAPLINTVDIGNSVFPQGLLINISSGTLIGGVRGNTSGKAGIAGNSGGTAFRTRVPVTINNQGTIAGGGGSGSAGASRSVRYSSNSSWVTSEDGYGGAGQGFLTLSSLVVYPAQGGDSATRQQYSGAVIGGHQQPWCIGGTGGRGGVWGVAGSTGSYVTQEGGTYVSAVTDWTPAAPGAGGASVDGNSYITWVNYGIRNGPLIN